MANFDSGFPRQDRGNATPPADSGATRFWFAVYTSCRHEKRVALHLKQREIDHYLPLYTSQRRWRDGSKVSLELPLFPCYIFVQISRQERVRVLEVPGAVSVVGGTGGEPAAISELTLEALRKGIAAGSVEPHPHVTAGQRVRVKAGAFAGMNGIVARKKGSFRVVLTLEQIMQSIAVEVDEADLEPMEPRCETKTGFAAGVQMRWLPV